MTSVLGETSLRILAAVLDRPGNPPTVRELMVIMGCRSPHAVACHLDRLRDMGLVTWERKKARTLRATFRWIPAEEL